MENNSKLEPQKSIIDLIDWQKSTTKGTIFVNKINKESIIVVKMVLFGADCKDSKGDIKYYSFTRLIQNYDMIKTDMADILYRIDR